jgi:hypothetical protein
LVWKSYYYSFQVIMKTCKGVRAQRSTESLKHVASAVNPGNPLADASEVCGVPCRTLRNWVSQEGSPVKKLGWSAALLADAEKQSHQRIVRLQVDSQVCSSSMQGTQHAKPEERQIVGKRLVCSLRRNPGLTLQKAENLSYGRPIIFSRETASDVFSLLRQTMDAMKMHQRPHLM